MKLNIVLVALFATLVGGYFLAAPRPSHAEGTGQGIQVVATAYTCEKHPRNFVLCRNLRWGGDVHAPGMACPDEWRNRVFTVPGVGVLRCDDTGLYDTWNGLPHIDVRLPTWNQANEWGVQRITIYPGEAVQQPQTTAPEPKAQAQSHTPEAAIALAHKSLPRGDASTAIVRLLRFESAKAQMPWLSEVVKVEGYQPIWLVTLWQPRDILPADATGLPNRDEPIATTLVILNADTGAVLGQTHITLNALNQIVATQDEIIFP